MFLKTIASLLLSWQILKVLSGKYKRSVLHHKVPLSEVLYLIKKKKKTLISSYEYCYTHWHFYFQIWFILTALHLESVKVKAEIQFSLHTLCRGL